MYFYIFQKLETEFRSEGVNLQVYQFCINAFLFGLRLFFLLPWWRLFMLWLYILLIHLL